MKANRGARGFGDEEQGVSSIVGAVIVFGLLVTTLITIRLRDVPVWDHDRESQFMDSMSRDMGYLKTDLDRQTANQSSASITDTIGLGVTSGFSFFHGYNMPGSLTFAPRAQGTGLQVSTPQLIIDSLNGADLQGLQPYSALTSGQVAATSVASFEAFRIRVSNPINVPAATPNGWAQNGGYILMDVTDAANNCAGQLRVAIGEYGEQRNIQTSTYPGHAGVCTPSPTFPAHTRWDSVGCLGQCPGTDPALFDLNLLDADIQLLGVLSGSPRPLTVAFNFTGSPAPSVSKILTYQQQVQGGTVRVGGGGYVANNYQSTASIGELLLHKQNTKFPTQTFTLEYGGIILTQEGGSVMSIQPSFRVGTTAGQASVEWLVPGITGTANQIGGTSGATVTSTPTGASTRVLGAAPQLTFVLTTDHASVWTNYWNTVFARAGFLPTTHYVITSTSTTATLTFYGPVGGPGDTVPDIQLNLAIAPLEITLRASG